MYTYILYHTTGIDRRAHGQRGGRYCIVTLTSLSMTCAKAVIITGSACGSLCDLWHLLDRIDGEKEISFAERG